MNTEYKKNNSTQGIADKRTPHIFQHGFYRKNGERQKQPLPTMPVDIIA